MDFVRFFMVFKPTAIKDGLFLVGKTKMRENSLTFSMMHTRLMVLPSPMWYSPLPRMKADGTTTCRL